mmetsp:Transcript_91203/g.257589  ORF Transcript_91203/g.257589 Transcript_91203/m.257589 type:complete len:230 (-) Transcript_91203:26-715(-)
MLRAVHELALKPSAIGLPGLHAVAGLEVIFPLARVGAIRLVRDAHALSHVVFPLADVCRLAFRIHKAAMAIRLVPTPLALVGSAVDPLLDAETIAVSALPLAFVLGGGAERVSGTFLLLVVVNGNGLIELVKLLVEVSPEGIRVCLDVFVLALCVSLVLLRNQLAVVRITGIDLVLRNHPGIGQYVNATIENLKIVLLGRVVARRRCALTHDWKSRFSRSRGYTRVLCA